MQKPGAWVPGYSPRKENMASSDLKITIDDIFKFRMKELVFMKDLDRTGIVKSILIYDHGLHYEVRYFHNGYVKAVYLYEDELEKK